MKVRNYDNQAFHYMCPTFLPAVFGSKDSIVVQLFHGYLSFTTRRVTPKSVPKVQGQGLNLGRWDHLIYLTLARPDTAVVFH